MERFSAIAFVKSLARKNNRQIGRLREDNKAFVTVSVEEIARAHGSLSMAPHIWVTNNNGATMSKF
jgi:hypothetical protein